MQRQITCLYRGIQVWRLPIITCIVPKQRYIRHPKTFDVTLQRYDTVTPRPFDESDYIIMYYTVVESSDVYFPHTF